MILVARLEKAASRGPCLGCSIGGIHENIPDYLQMFRVSNAMAKSRLLDRLRRPPISYQEFMERHEEAKSVLEFFGPAELGPPLTLSQIYAALMNSSCLIPAQIPLPPIMEALKSHPFFKLLRAAARENCGSGQSRSTTHLTPGKAVPVAKK